MLLPRRLAGFAGLVTVVALGAPAFPARAQESPVVRQLSPVLSLTPQDPSSAGGFGASLAFDGQHLVVGTPRSHLDPWRQASGSVHFLSFHEGTFDWDWEYAIPTGAINEVLGGRVTLSGPFATAATASSGPSSGTNQGGSAPGSIRLYGHDGDGWHLSGSIVPRFPDEPNGFGDAVILGSGLAVAAPGTASGVREVSGAVLVYDRPFTGPPSAPHRIESPFPGRFTGFAGDLAAPDEDTLIVAAAGATVDGEAARGAVFVYRRTQTGWVEHQQIIDPGGRSHFYFGGSIAAFGNTLLVSSSVPSGPTRIHVLERDGDRWVSRGELEQPTGGILLPAMTLDGGWAAVYGVTNDPPDAPRHNTVWIYRRIGSDWHLWGRTTSSNDTEPAAEVSALALHGDLLFVGMPNAGGNGWGAPGEVYGYALRGAAAVPVEGRAGLVVLALLLLAAGIRVITVRHTGVHAV